MARYIDADALYKETEKKIKANNKRGMAVVDGEFLDLINDAFTEDVVPKSEEGAECPTCYGTGRIGTTNWLTKNMTKKQIAEEKAKAIAEHEQHIKAEFASEIFAEIEKYFDSDGLSVFMLREEFFELKKKYTDCDLSPAPEEKYFSPQQVREMSPRELHDNFEAIKKSMELWQI